MKPSSSIRYCWRVLGRSSRPRVLRRSSHWSPYALIVGTALREAPRAARVRSRSTCSTTELLLDADPPRACVSRLVRSVFGPSTIPPPRVPSRRRPTHRPVVEDERILKMRSLEAVAVGIHTQGVEVGSK